MSIPTIDSEVKQRVKIPFDIDYFTERLRTVNEYFIFPSPELWGLKKNLFLLYKNSTKIKFDAKYKMKPEYLSFDEYGTVILAPVLMYVNNVSCVEEFSLDYVLIPTKEAIVVACKDKFIVRNIESLNTVQF